MTITAAAVFLAQQWPVFACAADKRPVTKHGLHDATTDLLAVREMFARPGAAMIGVPTGTASGFFVVDLDVKDGAAGLEWLAANEHRIPATRRHGTRSGGVHLLFRMPEGRTIRNSASKIAPGVDVRGQGGYVIVPPSEGYRIIADAMPAEAPAWLLDLLDPPAPAPRPAAAPRTRQDGRGSPYAMAALSDECDRVLEASWGTQEGTLNAAALKLGQLAAAGEIDGAYAREALISAGLGMPSQPGREPWTPQDVRAKVERAFRDGMSNPRSAPPRRVEHLVRVEIVPPEPPPRDEAPDWVYAEPEPMLDGPAPAQPAHDPLWVDAEAWQPEAIPPRPWLAPGYLLRGSVSMLSGAGAGGKSSLMVRWTIALATGQAVADFRPVRPMVVVNYNVEDDADEQQRRYTAALQLQRLTPADIARRVIRCGPHDVGTLFERDPVTGRVEPTHAMARLERLLIETRAECLVCDPLAELHNSEENDNTAMRAVVAAFRALAKRLSIAVLILHHDRKGQGAAGDIDRMRGAGAIAGAIRVGLTLTTMTQDEAEQFGIEPERRRQHFRVDGAKSNYAPAQDAQWWRLEGVEIANGEHVAACAPWSPPSTFASFSMADCVAILDDMHRGTPTGVPWAVRKEAAEEWAGRLLTRRGASEAQAKAMLAAWREAGTIIEADTARANSKHKRRGYVVNIEAVAEMRRQDREASR